MTFQASDLTAANTSLTNLKRKLEGDVSQMHADYDNLAANARNSEEKARKVRRLIFHVVYDSNDEFHRIFNQ